MEETRLAKRPGRTKVIGMRRLFSIGPWLMELFNPPPRDSLSFSQKLWRSMLVTVTLVTICIISALVLSIGFFLVQRGREVLLGMPQLKNAITILAVSILVNVACVRALFAIRQIDRRMIPKRSESEEIELAVPPRAKSPDQAKA